MASGTLQSAGIARHTIWAARLVVLAVFLDLFGPVPDHRAVRRGPRSIGRAGRYHRRRLLRNQPVREPGRRIRARQVGPPATYCRRPDDHDRRRIQLLAGPDVGAVDRRKGDAWDWRGGAGAGCVSMIGDRAPSDSGSGHGPDRGSHRRRGPGGTSGRRNPARHVGRRRGFFVDSAVLLMTLITFLVIARDDVSTAQEGTPAPLIASHEITVRKPALWSAYGATFAITVGIGRSSRTAPGAGRTGRDRRADWLQFRHLCVVPCS